MIHISKKRTHEEFVKEMYEINPNIAIIGKFLTTQTKVECQCLLDNHKWYGYPNNLLRGHGCSVCDGKKVIKGVNDLITKHPEVQEYLFNINDGYEFTSGSHKKIKCRCPDCGHEKSIVVKNLVNQGFSCDICTDGISYPNKFIRELLRQLKGNDYHAEYRPSWGNGYIYDCYFIENNKPYVIEMDGSFHYENKSWGNHDYFKQQKADREKDKLAYENGVGMIRIDSRKSEENYLKNNILNSELSEIFNLNNIDWDLCNKKALSNIVKEACMYYEQNKYNISDHEMARHFGVYVLTFRRYIKEGLKCGWCTKTKYDDSIIRSKFNNNPKAKPVQVFRDDIFIGEYPSINNCASNLSIKYNDKLYGSKIAKCIEGNREYHGFLFKYKTCE